MTKWAIVDHANQTARAFFFVIPARPAFVCRARNPGDRRLATVCEGCRAIFDWRNSQP
jgi:hypothetical protein